MAEPCSESNELGHRRDYCIETHAPRFDIIVEEIYNLNMPNSSYNAAKTLSRSYTWPRLPQGPRVL